VKYKKFATPNSNSPSLSINSLDEIPLPNELEIQSVSPDESEDLMESDNTSDTTDISLSDNTETIKTPNLLNRFFKNMAMDDVLLLAILILLLQEEIIYILLKNIKDIKNIIIIYQPIVPLLLKEFLKEILPLLDNADLYLKL